MPRGGDARAAGEIGIHDVRADEAGAARDEHVSHAGDLLVMRMAPATAAPQRKPPTCAHQATPATSCVPRAGAREAKPLKNCMANQTGRKSAARISAMAQ